jgi:lysine 2,3-aminomutase
LLVTGECAANCRYCFRRAVTGRGRGPVRPSELADIAAYLAGHPEIKELLLSGGDPLTLEDCRLFEIIDLVRDARPGLILRLGTRIPGVLPSRITRRLAGGLARRQPLWIVLHINHPRELTPEFTDAAGRLSGAGVPLLSQTVLLRGINDDAGTLEELFRGLLARRIKPYYLFQGDLAAGTAHFRVPLEKGFALMKDLRRRLSAMALPVYAVDLPGGGGKVPLTESYLREEDADFWIFESIDGKRYSYPKEDQP